MKFIRTLKSGTKEYKLTNGRLVRLYKTGRIAINSTSYSLGYGYKSAFRTLRYTTPANQLNILKQLDSSTRIIPQKQLNKRGAYYIAKRKELRKHYKNLGLI